MLIFFVQGGSRSHIPIVRDLFLYVNLVAKGGNIGIIIQKDETYSFELSVHVPEGCQARSSP
jgi:hypothetical protein